MSDRISQNGNVNVLQYARQSKGNARTQFGLACALVGVPLLAMFALFVGLGPDDKLRIWATLVMLLLAGCGACVLGGLSIRNEKERCVGWVALLLGMLELLGLACVVIYGVTHPQRYGVLRWEACCSSLEEIHTQMIAYTIDHHGRFPDRLEDLCDGHYFRKAASFTCPGNGRNHPAPYIYLGKGLSDPLSPSTVLIYEPLSNHGDGINVVYAGTGAVWLPKPQAEQLFQRLAAGDPPAQRRSPPSQPANIPPATNN